MRLDDGGTVWVVVRICEPEVDEDEKDVCRHEYVATMTTRMRFLCAFATERAAREHIADECGRFATDKDYRHPDELHIIPVDTEEGECDE